MFIRKGLSSIFATLATTGLNTANPSGGSVSHENAMIFSMRPHQALKSQGTDLIPISTVTNINYLMSLKIDHHSYHDMQVMVLKGKQIIQLAPKTAQDGLNYTLIIGSIGDDV